MALYRKPGAYSGKSRYDRYGHRCPPVRNAVRRTSQRGAATVSKGRVLVSRRLLAVVVAVSLLTVGSLGFRTAGCAGQDDNEVGNAFTTLASLSGRPASTPKGDWHKGEMPYLYQTDPAWEDKPYAGSTIGEAGCGPTALSMVYVRLTGKKGMGPVEMARYSQANGYTEGGATRWLLMSEGAQALGLKARELGVNEAAVREGLSQDNPVICIVGPGDFTTKGHFIVLSRLVGDDEVSVHDPNSVENSHKNWKLKRVLSQSKSTWVFSS